MSFSPLKAQIELAFSNAPVRWPEPENGWSGVPGGPVTSPATAAPTVRQTNRVAVPRARPNRDLHEVDRVTLCAPSIGRRSSDGAVRTITARSGTRDTA